MKGQEKLFSSASDQWSTPTDLFMRLHQEFRFTLDPCAMPDNGLGLANFYTEQDDGLDRLWSGETAFVNPPYSDIATWVQKCVHESSPYTFDGSAPAKIVMLIPARTDTRYWHNLIFQKADSVLFIKGRLKFGNSKTGAPFPSALVGFNVDLTPFTDLGPVMRSK